MFESKIFTSEFAKQLCGSSRFRRRFLGASSACGESGGGGGIFTGSSNGPVLLFDWSLNVEAIIISDGAKFCSFVSPSSSSTASADSSSTLSGSFCTEFNSVGDWDGTRAVSTSGVSIGDVIVAVDNNFSGDDGNEQPNGELGDDIDCNKLVVVSNAFTVDAVATAVTAAVAIMRV